MKIPILTSFLLLALTLAGQAQPSTDYLAEKCKRIILPQVEFQDTPLSDAVAFLCQKSVELDDLEPDPARKGINVVLLHEVQAALREDAGANGGLRISLQLRSVPFGMALHYVAQIAGFRSDIQPNAVVIGTEDEIGELREDLGLDDDDEDA